MNRQKLEKLGWTCITVWECEIDKFIDKVIQSIEDALCPNTKNYGEVDQ